MGEQEAVPLQHLGRGSTERGLVLFPRLFTLKRESKDGHCLIA